MNMHQGQARVEIVDTFLRLDEATLDAVLRLISCLNREVMSGKVYTTDEMTNLFKAAKQIQ